MTQAQKIASPARVISFGTRPGGASGAPRSNPYSDMVDGYALGEANLSFGSAYWDPPPDA